MNKLAMRICPLLVLGSIVSISSCAMFLLNGNLSHGYYEASSKTFRCRIPGGVLSRQLHIWDQSSAIGESVTFKLGSRLLWRVEHLRLVRLELAGLDRVQDRREQLERGKKNYFKHYLLPDLGTAEIRWERYERTEDTEVLIVHTYLESDGMAGVRELLFSVDGEYLNVVHHAQGISDNLENIIPGSFGLYKSCEFE